MGYDASAISRKIKRNTGGRSYRYKQARFNDKEQRTKASQTPKKLTSELISIINPIDARRGIRNPSHSIALRAPLSQFFSAIHPKPPDDALSRMDIVCVRYQDDILALCKSKRQLNRRRCPHDSHY